MPWRGCSPWSSSLRRGPSRSRAWTLQPSAASPHVRTYVVHLAIHMYVRTCASCGHASQRTNYARSTWTSLCLHPSGLSSSAQLRTQVSKVNRSRVAQWSSTTWIPRRPRKASVASQPGAETCASRGHASQRTNYARSTARTYVRTERCARTALRTAHINT